MTSPSSVKQRRIHAQQTVLLARVSMLQRFDPARRGWCRVCWLLDNELKPIKHGNRGCCQKHYMWLYRYMGHTTLDRYFPWLTQGRPRKVPRAE